MAKTTKIPDIVKQLQISGDLRKEFEQQAAIYAYWAFKCATANEQVRKHTELETVLFSQYYAEYRRQHSDAKENDCKSYIRTQIDYKANQERLARVQYQADVYKAAAKAFEMRASMLQQLGAMTRTEKETSMLTGSTVRKTRESLSHKATRVGQQIVGKRKG